LRAAILYAEPEFIEKSAQPSVVVLDELTPPKLLHAQPNVFMELLLPGLQLAKHADRVDHQFLFRLVSAGGDLFLHELPKVRRQG